MNNTYRFRNGVLSLAVASALSAYGIQGETARSPASPAGSASERMAEEILPTGMKITPLAAPGAMFEAMNPDLPSRPDFIAGQAVTTAISPDGTTMLVLTSGFNRNFGSDGNAIAGESNEYVFVYDIASGKPKKLQVLQVPNTFQGIAWNPKGHEFYVAGGVDDNVHVFVKSVNAWTHGVTSSITWLAWACSSSPLPAVWPSIRVARACSLPTFKTIRSASSISLNARRQESWICAQE